MTFISLACHWLLWTGNQYFLVRKKMEDLNILQWKFSSSSNRRKSLRLLGRRSNFMKNINNTQPPCWEGRRLFRQGNMIPEIIFNIRFGKVCSSSPCFLPGQEPHYPSSTSPHLFWNNIFTSKIIMSETWDISGHLSLHYFVSKSKYSEILESFCAGVSLSSLPNSNSFTISNYY